MRQAMRDRLPSKLLACPAHGTVRECCRSIAILGAFLVIVAPQSVSAQVPVSDKPRLGQETQTTTATEAAKTQTKRWLQYEEGVACGVFRNPARNSADAMQRTEITNLIRSHARAAGVRQEFALAIAMQESRFSQNVRSCAGAIGVMQLMPGTARQLGVDPYDLEDNIRGGVRYLKDQLIRFDGDETLAAAAYNAGPHRASLQAGRVPNIPETQTYVREVFGRWEPQFRVLVGSGLGPSLASANGNLMATARGATGSIGGAQELGRARLSAISREGALAGAPERLQDSWEDNAQARVIAAQSFNRAIEPGNIIAGLLVAQLIHELTQTSQTSRAMTYNAAANASASAAPASPPTIAVPAVPVSPDPCAATPGQTSAACTTQPRIADQTANVSSWLAKMQTAANSDSSNR